MDEAFLYERSIDIEKYDHHRDKLRGERTLAQMERSRKILVEPKERTCNALVKLGQGLAVIE